MTTVVADVNRDGKADLLVLNYGSDSISILLGNGTGGFTRPPGSPMPTAGNAQSITVGDFNIDGNPDIAVVHAFPGSVLVYLGNGTGGFAATGQPVFAGVDTVAIGAGDFDLDGKLDVVVTDLNVKTVRVLLGNGAGGFTEAPGSPVSAGSGPGLVVADLNLDGKPDLAVGDQQSGTVAILLGNGSGGFSRLPNPPGNMIGAYSLAVGDLNLDGNPDIVVASQLHLTILLGDGTGVFASVVALAVRCCFVGVSVGDFNADHTPDVAVLNYSTEAITILLGNGLGGFVALQDPSFAVGSRPLSAAVGDFNLDGKTDLAVANQYSHTVTILLNDAGVAPEGTACSDGNACTASEACQVGSCIGGVPVDCEDEDVCTNDSCDPATGCVHAFEDTVPPSITCPAPIATECQGNLQSTVVVPLATATDVCQPSGILIVNSRTPNGADASGDYPLGTTPVTFTATDGSGNRATCQTTVTVSDTTPPVVNAAATPNVLWPPNHKLSTVNGAVIADDACDPAPSITLASVTSSEPDDAPGGDGQTTGDIQDASIGTPDFLLLLRAERDGSGPGRTYTIAYLASDHSGNAACASVEVVVPHDTSQGVEPLYFAMDGALSTTLIWGPVEGARYYDVIRGDLAYLRIDGSNIDLGPVVCIAQAITATTTIGHEDPEVPEPGQVYFYAVQYNDGVQDSSYGSESAGRARTVPPGGGGCR